MTSLLALTLLAVSPAYRLWLDEDVVYIVEPAEKAAFERLATDEECQQFISQFWTRRGGDKVRQEHYRRIQWAVKRYEGGWRTDQGRTYIRFGPPDEIEVNPEVAMKEKWLYKEIPGVGTNVIFQFGMMPAKR